MTLQGYADILKLAEKYDAPLTINMKSKQVYKLFFSSEKHGKNPDLVTKFEAYDFSYMIKTKYDVNTMSLSIFYNPELYKFDMSELYGSDGPIEVLSRIGDDIGKENLLQLLTNGLNELLEGSRYGTEGTVTLPLSRSADEVEKIVAFLNVSEINLQLGKKEFEMLLDEIGRDFFESVINYKQRVILYRLERGTVKEIVETNKFDRSLDTTLNNFHSASINVNGSFRIFKQKEDSEYGNPIFFGKINTLLKKYSLIPAKPQEFLIVALLVRIFDPEDRDMFTQIVARSLETKFGSNSPITQNQAEALFVRYLGHTMTDAQRTNFSGLKKKVLKWAPFVAEFGKYFLSVSEQRKYAEKLLSGSKPVSGPDLSINPTLSTVLQKQRAKLVHSSDPDNLWGMERVVISLLPDLYRNGIKPEVIVRDNRNELLEGINEKLDTFIRSPIVNPVGLEELGAIVNTLEYMTSSGTIDVGINETGLTIGDIHNKALRILQIYTEFNFKHSDRHEVVFRERLSEINKADLKERDWVIFFKCAVCGVQQEPTWEDMKKQSSQSDRVDTPLHCEKYMKAIVIPSR